MVRRVAKVGFLLAVLLCLPLTAGAQGYSFGPKLESKPYLSVDAAPQGSEFQLAVVIDITKPYHINANVVKDDFLIPTEVKVTAPKGLTAGTPVYPPFKVGTFFGNQELNVFEGKTAIKVPIRVDPAAAPGEVTLQAKVKYQACDDKNCFPPKSADLSIPVKIVAVGEPSNPINPEIFAAASTTPNADPPGASPGTGTEGGAAGTTSLPGSSQLDIAESINSRGWPVTLGIIFLLGLALNLTPCVYPLIPVTIGYFGSQAQGAENRRGRTFTLALFYVLGMALTYSTLGVVAALAGKTIGFVFQSPLVPLFVAAIIIALSLSMFGLYEIRPPSFIANNARARGGPLGAMFMGLIVGFVAAPCIGPVVAALVTFVAATRNPATGFGLFFTLAMGLGLPYLFLGAFTGAASALPKSGAWTEMVKRVFGVLMLGTAFYFLKGFMPEGVFEVLLPAYILAAGVYLIFGEHELAQKRSIVVFKTGTGLAAAAAAVWMLIGVGLSAGHPRLVEWTPYSSATLASAKEQGKPVMIDFYATWCTPCKQLERETFNEPRVAEALKDFVTVKADLTSEEDPTVAALRQQFQIAGVPTVVFLGPDGQELRSLRLQEFEPAERFIKRVETAAGSKSDSVAQLPR
jgi:thiol:disulfide interchange protein DsbD